MTVRYDYIGIETGENGLRVYGYGVYEDYSVLAGQTKRVLLGVYDTVEEAQKDYPAAVFGAGAGYVAPSLPDVAPAWFDPMDAGEDW